MEKWSNPVQKKLVSFVVQLELFQKSLSSIFSFLTTALNVSALPLISDSPMFVSNSVRWWIYRAANLTVSIFDGRFSVGDSGINSRRLSNALFMTCTRLLSLAFADFLCLLTPVNLGPRLLCFFLACTSEEATSGVSNLHIGLQAFMTPVPPPIVEIFKTCSINKLSQSYSLWVFGPM